MPTRNKRRITVRKSAPRPAPLPPLLKSALRKHHIRKSKRAASDSDSLRYRGMSETESEIRLNPYTKQNKSSEASDGYAMLTAASSIHSTNDDQETPYLKQLVKISGVDMKDCIKLLKDLNQKNNESIHAFFENHFLGNTSSPRHYDTLELLKDPRVNDLVCEAALMKE